MAQYKSYINADLVIGIFGLVLFAALTVPAYQIIWWLKDGVWHPQTLSLWLQYGGIAPPTTTWVGLQSLLDATLDLPVTIYIVSLDIILFWLVTAFHDFINKRHE